MKKIQIFEPAMCCSTGLCGVSVDPELLRISTVLNTLKLKGIDVERFNLSNAPAEFIKNQAVNDFIMKNGADKLPVTVVDGEILVSEKYPSNIEFEQWLELPIGTLSAKTAPTNNDCCGGGCC